MSVGFLGAVLLIGVPLALRDGYRAWTRTPPRPWRELARHLVLDFALAWCIVAAVTFLAR